MDIKKLPSKEEKVEEVSALAVPKVPTTPIATKLVFSEPNPLIPKSMHVPREPINNGGGCSFF